MQCYPRYFATNSNVPNAEHHEIKLSVFEFTCCYCEVCVGVRVCETVCVCVYVCELCVSCVCVCVCVLCV